MTYTVLEHNRDNVLLADGRAAAGRHRPDLESVTYLDHNGVPHTVHVPKELGFTNPEDIVTAVRESERAVLVARRELEQQHFDNAKEDHSEGLTERELRQLDETFRDQLAGRAPGKEQPANQGQGY